MVLSSLEGAESILGLYNLICGLEIIYLKCFYRMVLLLGPPTSGKTTLLLALAGKLGSDLQVRETEQNIEYIFTFCLIVYDII